MMKIKKFNEDQEWHMDSEIIDRIKELTIECPECESMWSDEQYQCGTCGGAGAGNYINVYEWLKENPESICKKD